MDFTGNDLRGYLVALWRWKWLIIGTFILTVVTAAVVTYLTPPTYEASVLVVLSQPIYQVQFDPRIVSQDTLKLQTAKATHELLAKDPVLVQQVLDTLGGTLPPGDRTVGQAGSLLAVREVSQEGVIRLTANHTDPNTARLLVDTWAQLYVERLNQLYGQTEQDLTTISTQLETARTSLDAAQTRLAEFFLGSRLPALQAQLEVRQNTLGKNLRTQEQLDRVINDAQVLRTQIQKADVRSMNLSTQLAILYLELGSLSVGSPTIALQMPLDQTTFTAASAADQVRYLDEFIVSAQKKKADLGVEVSRLEKEIPGLRSEIEKETAIEKQLTLARDVAWESFSSLSHKAAEVRISMELRATTGAARVAGPAVKPTEPVSPNLWRNVGLAATCGLLLGVGCAFAIEYVFRRPEERPVGEQTGVIGEK